MRSAPLVRAGRGGGGRGGSDDRALAAAAALLEEGGILALKGVGGYHLAVDAGRAAAVSELRRRKGRDAKPFAVMVPDAVTAATLVRLSEAGRALLESPAAPIVLAPIREAGAETGVALAEVAPALDRLGVMLPSSPLHHLLLRELARPLVMTSGNRTDDPLARDDDAALADLGHIADAFLQHDRPIVRAVDDSVWLDQSGAAPVALRRARGAVPEPVQLPCAAPEEGLCMGADLKGALALVRSGGQVILGQHLGDLDHLEAFRRAETTAGDLLRLYDARPAWVAVDAHPGYRSHRLGRDLARTLGAGRDPIPVVEVQHHHAHLASLLVEHDRVGPVVGIVADGVGFGADGSAWGGEILVGDLVEVERAGHLRPLRLPGGDAAARETGRCALSWMVDALGLDAAAAHPLARELIRDDARRTGVLSLLERDLRCPPSSGLGRLFDAAASLLGVCPENRYEAESGQRLEALARRSGARPDGAGVIPEVAPTRRLEDGNHEAGTGNSPPFELDHRPLLISLLQRVQKGYLTSDLAWFFHDAVADALARGALRATREAGLGIVGLSGGVFCNELLSGQVQRKLEAHGLQVLRHQQVPPNDGGIALGQAAVASARGRLTTG